MRDNEVDNVVAFFEKTDARKSRKSYCHLLRYVLVWLGSPLYQAGVWGVLFRRVGERNMQEEFIVEGRKRCQKKSLINFLTCQNGKNSQSRFIFPLIINIGKTIKCLVLIKICIFDKCLINKLKQELHNQSLAASGITVKTNK